MDLMCPTDFLIRRIQQGSERKNRRSLSVLLGLGRCFRLSWKPLRFIGSGARLRISLFCSFESAIIFQMCWDLTCCSFGICHFFSVLNVFPRGRMSLSISLHLSIRRLCQGIGSFLMAHALVHGYHWACCFCRSPTVGSSSARNVEMV